MNAAIADSCAIHKTTPSPLWLKAEARPEAVVTRTLLSAVTRGDGGTADRSVRVTPPYRPCITFNHTPKKSAAEFELPRARNFGEFPQPFHCAMLPPPASCAVPVVGQTAPATVGRNRIAGLDGVRALALLLVLLSHVSGTPRFPFRGVSEQLPHIGLFGVQIFFVLSGFLQTSLLLSDERRFGRVLVRRFYARRILRIAPLGLLYLLTVCGWAAISRYQISLLDVASVLFCFKHVVGAAPLLEHFWSLSIEILFYIAWPLVLARLPVARRPAAALGAVVAMPLSTLIIGAIIPNTGTLSLSHFFRGEGLMLGCWLAFRQDGQAARPARGSVAPVFLAALIAGVLLMRLSAREFPAMREALKYLTIFPAGVMVLSAMRCRSGWLSALLNCAFARWLAMVSFGTYVWQQMFFFAAPQELLLGWPPPARLYWAVWFPGNLCCAIAAGALSYYAIERPLRPWREKLAAALTPRPA